MKQYNKLSDTGILQLIRENPNALKKEPSTIQNFHAKAFENNEIRMAILNLDIRNYQYFPADIKKDKELVRYILSKNVQTFTLLPDELRNDLDFAFHAIKQDGNLLGSVNSRLQNNKDLVITALNSLASSAYSVLLCTSKKLRADPDIASMSLTKDGRVLNLLNSKFSKIKEYVKLAVEQNGYALEFASSELKNDKDIVRTAIANTPYALRRASWQCRKDKEIVMQALTHPTVAYTPSIEDIKIFRDDKDVMLAALLWDTSGHLLAYVSDRLKHDMEILLTSIYRSSEQQNKKEMLFQGSIHSSHRLLENDSCIPEHLRDNPAILFMQNNRKHISFEQFPIILKALVEKPDLFLNPPDIILDAAESCGDKYLMLAQYALNPANDAYREDILTMTPVM